MYYARDPTAVAATDLAPALNLIFVAAVQLIAIPALMIFYNLPLGQIAAPADRDRAARSNRLGGGWQLFSAMTVNTWFKLLLALDTVSSPRAR